MTDSQVYAGAITLGVIAGMRSMSAPAIVSGLTSNGLLPVRNRPLEILAHPAAVATTALLAAGEVVADKLPFVPARVMPGPLAGRAISGAMCGAAISSAKERSVLFGVLLGACAAIGSTFAAYHLRRSIGKHTGLPDLAIALVEDGCVEGAGWLLFRSLQAGRRQPEEASAGRDAAVMNWVAAALGLLFLASLASDAFEVMLLPRRVRRQLRPVLLFFTYTWRIWASVATRIERNRLRDTFLSLYGPLSMVVLLSLWSFGLIISFGLLAWALRGDPSTSILSALYLSGVTFFTLGYGDVLPKGGLAKGLAVFESGAGLAFIAVTIGYLPVLYQLFSRREASVLQLDARAGSPPVGASMLCRHSDGEAMPELETLLKEWEQWSAELVESHLSYPMLSYYRSQHDNQSWLAALTAVLDTCALILTGFSGVRTFQARMTFAMGRLAAIELCRVFHIKVGKPSGDRLDSDGFRIMQAELDDAGLTFSDGEDAETRLASLRSTYEPFLYALSERLLLPLPPWTSDDQLDNWQRSQGGSRARDIVDAAPVKPD